MHALQTIPLGLVVLELLSYRISVLREPPVRLRLVAVGALAFTAMLSILTWQALLGESIVRPSGPILVTGLVTAAGTVGAALGVLLLGGSARARAPERSPRSSQLPVVASGDC